MISHWIGLKLLSPRVHYPVSMHVFLRVAANLWLRLICYFYSVVISIRARSTFYCRMSAWRQAGLKYVAANTHMFGSNIVTYKYDMHCVK